MTSTEGLILVIPDKPDDERDAVAAVWGGEVVRLGRFWDPPPLDAARVRLYGAEAFCQVLAQKLGLELVSPPDDWLLGLPDDLVKRMISRTPRFPAFVKSLIPKLVPARVRERADYPDDVDVMFSDVVELIVEARAWVLDGDVAAIACYEGEASLVNAGQIVAATGQGHGVGAANDAMGLGLAEAARLARAAAVCAPSPCVIDVGLTRDRGWVVVEANAAWGAGLNGCDPAAAARCIARATRPAGVASGG